MKPTSDTEHLPPLPTFKSLKRTPPMAPNPNTPSLNQMNQDQIISILHLLPFDSVLSCSMTCRRFRSIAAADSLWESICRRDWGGSCVDALLASLSAHERRELSWKRLYQKVSQMGSLTCRLLSSKDGPVPRPRASHSLSFVGDCLVLFGGGYEGGRHLDDTWVAYIGNGSNRALAWQQVSSGIPSGRFGQSCTVVGDTVVLFGGINDIGVRQNDTWIGQVIREGPLDTKIPWRLLDPGHITPPPRGAHAACHAGDRKVVIHGGIGHHGVRLTDTWLLDLSDSLGSARWHQISSGRPSPPARSGHSLTWIERDRMVLFGGRGSGYEVLNDAWILDMESGCPEWKEIKNDSHIVPGEIPLPRSGHSATPVLGGRVLIYGGEDSERRRKDDFWVLDVGAPMKRKPGKMWKKLSAEGHSPEYRSFHGACTDRSGRCIFVVGGMVDGDAHHGGDHGLRFDGELYLVELVL